MKKAIFIFLLPLFFQVNGQTVINNTTDRAGFQADRMFTGGSFNLGFGTGSTSLGISPQLGYSVTNWLDAGITINVNYISQRDVSVQLDKLRQTTYGPGAFVRLFPVNFLFGSAAIENNTIRQKYIPAISGSEPEITRVNSNSLLLGGGYASGRQKGENSYYYISVSWDVMGDANSPYLDGYGRANPVFRAGLNVGLFQGRNQGRNKRY